MAGRGRGGGGGRGRGRATMSFDVGQLGFGAGEAIPGPVLQPPPTYPTLEYKPAPLKIGPESEYMLVLKRDFVEFLRGSSMHMQHQESVTSIERFSDKYRSINNLQRDRWDQDFNWKRLPAELKPKTTLNTKRKMVTPNTSKIKRKNIDVVKKLDELAKLEKKNEEDDSETENKDVEDKEEDEEENTEEQDVEDLDDEMDLGTDYVNNYFDNGESYIDDEDDNMDDGPVY